MKKLRTLIETITNQQRILQVDLDMTLLLSITDRSEYYDITDNLRQFRLDLRNILA